MPLSARRVESRADVEAQQLAKLRSLLTALVPNNRFYAPRLQAAGLDRGIASIAEFVERMPFTVKQDLIEDQAANPPYGSNLTFPLERYSRYHQTSGTSGQPIRWLDTAESWDWMVGNWRRVFDAAGITSADRIFFAFSFGPFLGFWVAFDCATSMGALAIPGGGMRSAARLHAMIEAGATVLCCTPTYAIRLGETAIEENVDLSASRVRTIVNGGEAGASIPGTRARMEQLWHGARVMDHHGMTEIGPASYGCPRKPGVLHIIESEFIAEILDSGELVLTNLGRTGSPLLRYRTGDLVKRVAGERCECGSYDLALEGGILARTDDMVVVRGVNIYPSAVEDVLRQTGISEYQVAIRTVHAMPEMSIQIESPSGQVLDGIEHRVEAALSSAFGLRIPVMVAQAGTLPRFEMKAKRWVRL